MQGQLRFYLKHDIVWPLKSPRSSSTRLTKKKQQEQLKPNFPSNVTSTSLHSPHNYSVHFILFLYIKKQLFKDITLTPTHQLFSLVGSFELGDEAIELVSVVAGGRAARDVLGPPKVENEHGALLLGGVVERPVRLRVVEDQDLVGLVVLDLREEETENGESDEVRRLENESKVH